MLSSIWLETLVINTDGSAFRNGKSDAVAGVGVYFGTQDKMNYGEPLGPGKQTNQRAELMAVKIALQRAPMKQNVTIRSDSQYAISCSTVWPRRWRLASWRKAEGIYKENMDIITDIERYIQLRDMLKARTDFEWVKGHAGDPGNEAADKLAVKGSKKAWNLAMGRDKPPRRAMKQKARLPNIFCAIYLPENRRKVHCIPRRDIGKYTTGEFCRYQVFVTHADAAHFRDFGVARGEAPRKEIRFASPARSEYFDEGIEDVWAACEVSLLDGIREPLANNKRIPVMAIAVEC